MRKSILQVYILCCGETGENAPDISPKVFDAYFCQNTKEARTCFEKTIGRVLMDDEVWECNAQELLTEITALDETAEHVLIVASTQMACALAGVALEIPMEAVPMSIEPLHYVHLQWGNKRCPGKWFMQRWNAKCLPAE